MLTIGPSIPKGRRQRGEPAEPDGRVQEDAGLVREHLRPGATQQADRARRAQAQPQGPLGRAHDLAQPGRAALSPALPAALASHRPGQSDQSVAM